MSADEDHVLRPRYTSHHGTCWVLTYRPFRVQLEVQTRPHWIRVSDARSMEQVTRELLDVLAADIPACDTDAIHHKLTQQEEQYSSLIGYDIALPHSYTDALDSSILLIAKMRHPITCKHTTEKIRFVFMVLSPQDKPRSHLNALSEISAFIMSEENRRHLAAAESDRDLVALFFPDTEDTPEPDA